MLTRPLIFSLFAGAAVAYPAGSSSKPCVDKTVLASNTTPAAYGPTGLPQPPSPPVPSTLPTVTGTAATRPPTPPASSTPAPSSSRPFNDDQPAPYGTASLPASELFNPSNAAYFSLNIPTPSFANGIDKSGYPVYPEYPQGSSQSGSLSTTPAPTLPTYPAYPVSTTSAASTNTPPSIPANSTSSNVGGSQPAKLSIGTGQPTGSPTLPESLLVPTGTRAPQLPPFSTSSGTPAIPAYPTATGTPCRSKTVLSASNYAHPRPTGFWPGHASPYHTSGNDRGDERGPRPFANSRPGKQDNVEGEYRGQGQGQAKSTPCTLETRVRPSATTPPLA